MVPHVVPLDGSPKQAVKSALRTGLDRARLVEHHCTLTLNVHGAAMPAATALKPSLS